MGRGGNNSHSHPAKGRTRKSKGRMSYLRRQRAGGGGGAREAKEDEFGQKYGDYVPAYGSNPKQGRNFGGRRREVLKPGMKGFLCTTNFKENECVREAFNILNEYCEDTDAAEEGESSSSNANQGVAAGGDTLVSSEKTQDREVEEKAETKPVENPVTSKEDIEDEDIDIDEALTSELKNLRSEKTIRKFNRADTGVTNVVFISTTIDNPSELAYRIFEDVTEKKQTKSRFLLRLLPIELTCNANNVEEVKSKAKEIIERHMKTGYLSFRITANVRLNGKLKKDEFIKSLADVVSQVNPLSFVDLNNPQYTIVLEVLKTTLCLGIVKDFNKFKKYNLLEAGSCQVPAQVSDKANVNAEVAATSPETTEITDIKSDNQVET